MTACICTARSFSLTHPTQLIHFQSPPFRRNSYPSCCSQRCSVDRQPTPNVHLTWAPVILEFAGINVCLHVGPLSSLFLRAEQTKWSQQVSCSFDMINWTHYYQKWFWFVGSPYAVRLSQNSQRCCKVNCLSLVFGWFLSRISALWVDLKFFVAVWFAGLHYCC